MPKRVVITACGIVSARGHSLEELAAGLFQAPCLTPFPERPEVLTVPVTDFEVRALTGRNKNLRYLPRGAAFALGAALRSQQQHPLTETEKQRCGLFLGVGPNLDWEGTFPGVGKTGLDWEKVPALWLLKFLPNTAAAMIAKTLGLHGENATISTACSASLQALGEAYRKIRDGYLIRALAGGGDSRLSQGGLRGYQKAGALFQPSVPETAYVPFANVRYGFVPGEGGAMLLLEELNAARKRRATILAEICGYGASLDGAHLTAPDVSGQWAEQAVRDALREAAVTPEAIGLVSAHGTGTVLNDRMEAELLQRLFATDGPPVTAFKSRFGHLSAACGAMELSAVLACWQAGQFPEIPGLRDSCAPEVSFLTKPLKECPETVLLENFGFGGQNSALVVKQWRN